MNTIKPPADALNVKFDDSTHGLGSNNTNNNQKVGNNMTKANNSLNKTNTIKLVTNTLGKYGIYAAAAAGMFIVGTEALAVFDLGLGVTAATDPFKTAFTGHWGKAVGLAAVATYLVSQGDPRARATTSAIVAVGGSMVCLGIIELFFK